MLPSVELKRINLCLCVRFGHVVKWFALQCGWQVGHGTEHAVSVPHSVLLWEGLLKIVQMKMLMLLILPEELHRW